MSIKLNKEKRNCNDVTKRELYVKQKKIVQTKIIEQMNIYEMKITNDIRQDRSRGKYKQIERKDHRQGKNRTN